MGKDESGKVDDAITDKLDKLITSGIPDSVDSQQAFRAWENSDSQTPSNGTTPKFQLICPYRAYTGARTVISESTGPIGCYIWTILFTVLVGAILKSVIACSTEIKIIEWFMCIAAAGLAEIGMSLTAKVHGQAVGIHAV